MLVRRFNPNRKDPVEMVYADGTKLLLSYETPVAAFIPGQGYLVTDLDVIVTTERRIAEWLTLHKDASVRTVPQAEIFRVFTDRPVVTRTNRDTGST